MILRFSGLRLLPRLRVDWLVGPAGFYGLVAHPTVTRLLILRYAPDCGYPSYATVDFVTQLDYAVYTFGRLLVILPHVDTRLIYTHFTRFTVTYIAQLRTHGYLRWTVRAVILRYRTRFVVLRLRLVVRVVAPRVVRWLRMHRTLPLRLRVAFVDCLRVGTLRVGYVG